MLQHSLRNASISLVLVLGLVSGAALFSSCGKKGLDEKAFQLPEANLVVEADVGSMQNSAFYKYAKEIVQEHESLMNKKTAQNKEKLEKSSKKLREITGLEKGDVQRFALYINLSDYDFNPRNPPKPGDIPGVATMTLNKPLSFDQLKSALQYMKKQGKEEVPEAVKQQTKPVLQEVAYAGQRVMKVSAENRDYTFAFGVSPQSNLVYAGTSATVKAILKGEKKGKDYAEETRLLREQVPEGSQGMLLFNPSDQLRERINAQAEKAKESGRDAGSQMMMRILEPIRTLEGVYMACELKKGLGLRLGLIAGDEQKAEKLKGLADSMLIPSVKSYAEGKSMAFVDSLETDVTEDNIVSLELTFKQEDLDAISESASSPGFPSLSGTTSPSPKGVLDAYNNASGKKLGKYLSAEENLSSAVVIRDMQSQRSGDEKSQLKGFRNGFEGEIVDVVSPGITQAEREKWPETPDGEVDRPADWFQAEHFRRIVSEYSGQYDVIVSLIGLPSDAPLGDILGGSNSPKLALMNEEEQSLAPYSGLVRDGTIAAAVVDLPFSKRRQNINYDDPAMPPNDVDEAFSNMFKLVTADNL